MYNQWNVTKSNVAGSCGPTSAKLFLRQPSPPRSPSQTCAHTLHTFWVEYVWHTPFHPSSWTQSSWNTQGPYISLQFHCSKYVHTPDYDGLLDASWTLFQPQERIWGQF